MDIVIKILGVLSISIGVFAVLVGTSDDAMSSVIGGGLFMALGIAVFILNKNN